MKRLIVGGADGKTGKTVIGIAEQRGFEVVAGVDKRFAEQKCPEKTTGVCRGDCEYVANEDNYFKYSDYSRITVRGDAVIDFSSPEGTLAALEYAVKTKTPTVIAATGLKSEHYSLIEAAAKEIPVVCSENYSFGVNAFVSAVKTLVKPLAGYAAYIEEIHHLQKKDAPSGTAKSIKRAIEEVSDIEPEILSLRGGDVKGTHTVYLLGKNETIEIKHTAFSREIFADGALICARRLIGLPPKLYTVNDLMLCR